MYVITAPTQVDKRTAHKQAVPTPPETFRRAQAATLDYVISASVHAYRIFLFGFPKLSRAVTVNAITVAGLWAQPCTLAQDARVSSLRLRLGCLTEVQLVSLLTATGTTYSSDCPVRRLTRVSSLPGGGAERFQEDAQDTGSGTG